MSRSDDHWLGRVAECEPATHPRQPIVPLSEREEEVAVTVAQGRWNAEIAAELYISLSTVKFHMPAS